MTCFSTTPPSASLLRRAGVLLILLLVAALPPPAAGADDVPRPWGDVRSGVIVVKLDAPVPGAGKGNSLGLAALDKVGAQHNVYSVEPAFPRLLNRAGKRAATEAAALQRIYYVRFPDTVNPRTVARAYARQPGVAYAEPLVIHRIGALPPGAVEETFARLRRDEVPDDPTYDQMTHLGAVALPEAWEVVKGEQGKAGEGNDRVVIAIADGGTDWRHQDLVDNVWTNADEIPDNNVDDDDNGYVDDVHGWNFANDSEDPTGLSGTPQNARHGTWVAGVAAATANNGLGVVGSSWNAQFMPINVSCDDEDRSVCYGYDGIVYAAENGADIVNASWGGPGLAQFLQDVVDFATASGTLVVTSAGNGDPQTGRGQSNDIIPQNPGNLRGVLSVGSTRKQDDIKSGFSNFGRTVDVFAPGEFTNTTGPNDQYTDQVTGTSFSAPLVAGVAALVKTLHPEWTVDQVREQLRITADNIDSVNPAFRGRMGQGRINAFRAVTVDDRPAIRLVDFEYEDENGDGEIRNGERVMVTARLTNYRADATNVEVRLLAQSSDVVTSEEPVVLSAFASGDTLSVALAFDLLDTADPAERILFFTEVSVGADYTDYGAFRLDVNPAVIRTHDTGPIQVTMTGQGNIGWTTYPVDSQLGELTNSQGVGFLYNDTNYLFEGGLIMGNSIGSVSDAIRNTDDELPQQDKDFIQRVGSALDVDSLGVLADELITVEMSDAPARSPIGVEVLQESFANTAEDRNDFIIIKYTVTNPTAEPISDFHAGLFFDWDLATTAADFGRYDAERRMGIAQNRASNPSRAVGTKLLNPFASLSYRTIDNPAEIYGNTSDGGFTAREKWDFLSDGIQTTTLDNVDISTMIAGGPYTIKPECSIEVAFAVVAAAGSGSLSDLLARADAAQAYFDEELRGLTPNEAPTFATVPDAGLSASEGSLLEFTFEATDADACDAPAFVLLDGPDGATIERQTGVFRFEPDFDQGGTYPITVGVTDGKSLTTLETTVTVEESNRAPAFSAVLADTIITSAQTITFDFSVDDPDGDAITYALGSALENATIDAETGRFTFAPTPTQLGTFTVRVNATDGAATIQAEAVITVIAPEFRADAPYPNPGSPPLTFDFQTPASGTATLRVFDLMGREVRTLVAGDLPPGPHTVTWDGTNNAGQGVSSGVYFYRLRVETADGAFDELLTVVLVR